MELKKNHNPLSCVTGTNIIGLHEVLMISNCECESDYTLCAAKMTNLLPPDVFSFKLFLSKLVFGWGLQHSPRPASQLRRGPLPIPFPVDVFGVSVSAPTAPWLSGYAYGCLGKSWMHPPSPNYINVLVMVYQRALCSCWVKNDAAVLVFAK